MPDPIKMTVSELTAAVAVEVMGWRKSYVISRNTEGWLGCGTIGRVPCWRIGRSFIRLAIDFSPDRTAHHRDWIVDRMQHLGCEVIMDSNEGCWLVSFCAVWRDLGNPPDAKHETLGLAVMLAALEAMTGQRVELTDE